MDTCKHHHIAPFGYNTLIQHTPMYDTTLIKLLNWDPDK